jgi:hypothetical protein
MARSTYTHSEVLLCAYAARFDGNAFGGVNAIRSLSGRSAASIVLKIQNIAAMLDEQGIPRSSDVPALTGLPAGQRGRRTNWDVVSRLVELPQHVHLDLCRQALAEVSGLPGELPAATGFIEGAVRHVLVNAYERDPEARAACLAHYGATCIICGFDFGATYGAFASGFIHVHHVRPLSEIAREYEVDPVADLRPVCPNCHAAIHIGGGSRSVEDVRAAMHRA